MWDIWVDVSKNPLKHERALNKKNKQTENVLIKCWFLLMAHFHVHLLLTGQVGMDKLSYCSMYRKHIHLQYLLPSHHCGVHQRSYIREESTTLELPLTNHMLLATPDKMSIQSGHIKSKLLALVCWTGQTGSQPHAHRSAQQWWRQCLYESIDSCICRAPPACSVFKNDWLSSKMVGLMMRDGL